MKYSSDLFNKIRNKKAKVAILGLGYVGSNLSSATSSSGYKTLGFDVDKERVADIIKRKKENLTATDNFSLIKNCDIVCICVPTLLNKNTQPNLKFLKAALSSVSQNIRHGQLIVVESSVTPGITRNLVLPTIKKSELIAGSEFFLAYSPERIDPGNRKYTMQNVPKVVGGLDKISLRLAVEFYSGFVEKVIPVSSLEVAEMTKVLENTFRLVNISLINELAEYTRTIGINIWEVISAASTKPFGFLAHYPGSGAGGYCIPVVPYFLFHDAKNKSVSLPLVKSAIDINNKRPKQIVKKAVQILNGNGENKKQKILLVGLAYKPGSGDIRNSSALNIWKLAKKKGVEISYHDPFVPRVNGHCSAKLSPGFLAKQDLIIIAIAQENISYDQIAKSHKPIIDTSNVISCYYKASNIFHS